MQAGSGGEMSFLEHLEELRRTLIRMCLVLLLGMVGCFAFAPDMLELLRHPVEEVWAAHERAHLPGEVDVRNWMMAKDLERVRRSLSPEARDLLESRYAPEVRELADALPLLRAAMLLPEAEREPYLRQASSGAVQVQALQLYEAKADLDDGRGRVESQMMGAFQPGEAFMLSLQLAFFGGVVVAGPLLVYFLLQFVLPGLLEHEKRIILRSLVWGVGLFLLGCAFSYFAVLPRVLAFFFVTAFAMMSVSNAADSYFMTYNVGATPLLTTLFMWLGTIPAFIFMPLVPAIKRKIGKKGMFYLFLGVAILGMAMMYTFVSIPRPQEQFLAAVHRTVRQ